MTSIAITAHLYSGFASSDPWSPSIDGIIGYWWMREHLGPDLFAITQSKTHAMKPADQLPLKKIEYDGQWWYACSSPIYQNQATVHRHIHRRFDQPHAEKYLPDNIKKVVTKAGSYKNFRMIVQQHITDCVTWHVIGDRAEIERLLSRCSHIGAKVGAGFGRVRRWSYAEGDAEIAQYLRPLPVAYANEKVIDGDPMWWGLRPPARLPENCVECLMPRVRK
jgi:CRISPR type IV-associated protein Csf3